MKTENFNVCKKEISYWANTTNFYKHWKSCDKKNSELQKKWQGEQEKCPQVTQVPGSMTEAECH